MDYGDVVRAANLCRVAVNLKWAKSFTLLGIDFNVDKDIMVAEIYNSKLHTIEKQSFIVTKSENSPL